mgnify:FL=1
MNMFKPVGATSIKEYFSMLTDERREQVEFLDGLIKKTVPKLKPWYVYNMLGYGDFDYVDYKKQPGKWPVVALASQKNYISLYVCAIKDGEYLAEKYKDTLGKVNVGKSCIRFKKIDDLDITTLKTVLKEAEKTPGLIEAGEQK